MHHYGASGYVLPLDKFLKAVSPEHAEAYLAEFDDDSEGIDALEDEISDDGNVLPLRFIDMADIPQPDVFRLNDEDDPAGSDLESGVWFVSWQTNEVYYQDEKEWVARLRKKKATPVFQRWAVFG
jgi:hypothetical protein